MPTHGLIVKCDICGEDMYLLQETVYMKTLTSGEVIMGGSYSCTSCPNVIGIRYD